MGAPLSRTLGCSQNMQVRVQAQGGAGAKLTLPDPVAVSWSRVLDDTSEAQAVIPVRSVECCGALSGVRPWSHELAVVREGVTVWEGPITQVKDSRQAGTITLAARDVTAWFTKRRIRYGYDYTGNPQDLSVIAQDAIRDGLGVDDPNILKYLQVSPAHVSAERMVGPNTTLVDQEVRDMTSAGLNFTALGRAIYLFSQLESLLQIPSLTSGDFDGDVSLEWDGLGTVTDMVVNGEAVTGSYSTDGGIYGRLEGITKVDGILDTASANSAARLQVQASFPPPLFVASESVGALRSRAMVSIHDLIPGVTTTLVIAGNCSSISQQMRLEKVSVEWAEGVEKVSPTFVPVSGGA